MFPLSLDEPAPQGEFRYVRLHRPHTRLPPVKGVRASFWASVVGTTLSLKPKAGTRIAITARMDPLYGKMLSRSKVSLQVAGRPLRICMSRHHTSLTGTLVNYSCSFHKLRV